jgi:hypothetical protein
MQKQSHWWGEWRLGPGEVARFGIGPLTLYVQRLAQEWRIAHTSGGAEAECTLELPAADADLLGMPTVTRYVDSGGADRLELRAALADRPVVAQPERPLILPAGEEVRCYVRTPLWAQICIGEPARQLTEIPVVRPSDTWFGPITEGGELCYAASASFRLEPDGARHLPHRATTTVRLANRADSPLTLERLSLPVAHLALFADDTGRLWTDDVAFERTGGDDFAAVRLGGEPRASEVSAPRRRAPSNLVHRAFNSLFT